jgi:hypothetical protein
MMRFHGSPGSCLYEGIVSPVLELLPAEVRVARVGRVGRAERAELVVNDDWRDALCALLRNGRVSQSVVSALCVRLKGV